ncbi:MAG: PEP-CTERM sorting domain-containing protein [Phycisphaerales bacterium]|nr:PEP-CTERM sorting domain-containing protein [Phycisphaerales bacterium]
MKRFAYMTMLLAALMPVSAALAGGEEEHEHDDITVGHSGAGQLKVEFDFSGASELTPVSGLLNGWAGDEPGFAHLEADEPGEDFFTLATGANILFEVVSIDDALVGNPLTDAIDTAGDQLLLGDEELHKHIDWLINSDDPSFDPLQTVWTVQFKLLDTGATSYDESEVYTWNLTNVPEPATAMLMLVGCAAICRKRR